MPKPTPKTRNQMKRNTQRVSWVAQPPGKLQINQGCSVALTAQMPSKLMCLSYQRRTVCAPQHMWCLPQAVLCQLPSAIDYYARHPDPCKKHKGNPMTGNKECLCLPTCVAHSKILKHDNNEGTHQESIRVPGTQQQAREKQQEVREMQKEGRNSQGLLGSIGSSLS